MSKIDIEFYKIYQISNVKYYVINYVLFTLFFFWQIKIDLFFKQSVNLTSSIDARYKRSSDNKEINNWHKCHRLLCHIFHIAD